MSFLMFELFRPKDEKILDSNTLRFVLSSFRNNQALFL